MSNLKKPYTTPRLTVHGDVEKITLQGSEANADVINGAGGSAYAPGAGGGPVPPTS